MKTNAEIPRTFNKPTVSVIMPTYNANRFLRESIDSILTQSYKDWELLIINEPFSNDGTKETIAAYCKKDSRIRLLQNTVRLGLAESLNRGIREAQGIYIARADADDICATDRFRKQVEFLDGHSDISVVGSWQHHFGNCDFVHKPPKTHEELRASLIFCCNICHSTLMFRKSDFVENNLWYDGNYYAEDFELWTRAIHRVKFHTLQEILGEYRVSDSNITNENKKAKMADEVVNLVARTLREQLQINVPKEDMILLISWVNPFTDFSRSDRDDLHHRAKNLFEHIIMQNEKLRVYDQAVLSKVLSARENWMNTNESPLIESMKEVRVEPRKSFTLRGFIKRCLRPFYRPFYSRIVSPIMEIRQGVWALKSAIADQENNLRQTLANIEMRQIELSASVTKTNHELNEFRMYTGGVNSNLNHLFKEIFEHVSTANEGVNEQITKEKNSIDEKIKYIEITVKKDNEKKFISEHLSGKNIFLIGTPNYGNIGDAAITLGTYAFIREYFPGYKIVEITGYQMDEMYTRVQTISGTGDLIFLQGGGNLGDMYLAEESIRRKVISDFPSNRIVILPQTIYFRNTLSGHNEQQISSNAYGAHRDLTLFARGLSSLMLAKDYFPNAKSFNAPDMAHMLNYDFGLERKGLLLCIRALEDESGLNEMSYEKVFSISAEIDPSYTTVSHQSPFNISEIERGKFLIETLQRYARSKAVVTDRLHGMIFSIITKTPCVVLSAETTKLSEYAANFADTPAVRFIDRDIERLAPAIHDMLSVENAVYSFPNAGVFAEMAQIIKGKV